MGRQWVAAVHSGSTTAPPPPPPRDTSYRCEFHPPSEGSVVFRVIESDPMCRIMRQTASHAHVVDAPPLKVGTMIEVEPDAQVFAENTTWVPVRGAAAGDTQGWIAKSMGSVIVLERVDVTVGHFSYITVNNVALRETCSFSHPRSVGLKSGSVVECSALVAAEGTLWFLLSNGAGWLFEGREGKMALEPAPTEEGHFTMRVLPDGGGVVVRETASYDHPVILSTGQHLLLKPGAAVVCSMRLSLPAGTFYRLQDSKGWLPEADTPITAEQEGLQRGGGEGPGSRAGDARRG